MLYFISRLVSDLDLEVNMTTEQNFKNITIFMIGDSTMANKPLEQEVECGWGQKLPEFVKEGIVVDNHAKNGRSSKSFLGEGLWEPVYNAIQPGDWVIIQFGHNDQKADEGRRTEPFTTYADNLRFYVNQTLEKGGNPILCTSIVRGKFEDGVLQDTHGDYPKAAIQVAEEMNVPLLDLQKTTEKLVKELGSDNLKKFYVPHDVTHLSPWGATQVAQMACEEIKRLNIGLAEYLK